jgi:hypothetical protein
MVVQQTDIIPFQTTNTGVLTGGNTWNGNTFTVGASGAGLYYLEARLTSANIYAIPFLDLGGGYSSTSIYGTFANLTASGSSYISTPTFSKRGIVSSIIYLNAGTTIKVRAMSGSTVVGADLNGDASCRFTIVKL